MVTNCIFSGNSSGGMENGPLRPPGDQLHL
jgi:hypothetical protein